MTYNQFELNRIARALEVADSDHNDSYKLGFLMQTLKRVEEYLRAIEQDPETPGKNLRGGER